MGGAQRIVSVPVWKIGGLPVLNSASASWPLSSGPIATVARFDMAVADMQALLDKGNEPVEIECRVTVNGEDRTRKIGPVWVIDQEPGPDPFIRRAVVVDRRYWWSRFIISRDYNLRRQVGFFQIVADGVEELERTAPRIWYRPHSLPDPANPESPWRAADAFFDVLAYVLRREAEIVGSPSADVVIEAGTKIQDVELDEMPLDHPGNVAIGMALNYVPGLSFYVDDDGDVVVYDQTSGNEFDLLVKLQPQLIGSGHAVAVTPLNDSPSEIHVLFDVDAELRIDSIRDPDSTDPADPDENLRRMRLCLPSPDYQLANAQTGYTVPRGAFVDYDDLLASLPQLPNSFGAYLTDAKIRQAMIPGCDLWSRVMAFGVLSANQDWASRISYLQTYAYRMFRINKGWNDRVLGWREERVSTVEQARGVRGPAVAFADHAYTATTRSKIRDWAEGGQRAIEYFENVAGWTAAITSSSRPSPAKVNVDSSDMGIVSLDWQADAQRVYGTENILPGLVDDANRPGFSLEGKRSLTFNTLREVGSFVPTIRALNRVAVVLTASPAAPNSTRRLYRVVVKPEDIAEIAPRAAEWARSARGPIREVRISRALETARIPWQDARQSDIEAIFGMPPESEDTSVGRAPLNFAGLVMNDDPNSNPGPSGGASLRQIGNAVAARIWATFVRHIRGTITGAVKFDAAPTGWANAVVRTLLPSGVAVATAVFPERPPELDWISQTDTETQRILRQLPSSRWRL